MRCVDLGGCASIKRERDLSNRPLGIIALAPERDLPFEYVLPQNPGFQNVQFRANSRPSDGARDLSKRLVWELEAGDQHEQLRL